MDGTGERILRDRDEERYRDDQQGVNLNASPSWLTSVASKAADRGGVGTAAPCQFLAEARGSCFFFFLEFVCNLEPVLKMNQEKEK